MQPLPPHAHEVLAQGADLLDGLGVRWWIGAGTMLGFHRDGGFIPHDTDLDISLEGEEISPEVMKTFDFPVVRHRDYQWAVEILGVVFDIMLWKRRGDEMICETEEGTMVMPSRLFDSLGKVEFKGRQYPCPNPPEDYVRLRYGPEWHIPRTEKGSWVADTFNIRP